MLSGDPNKRISDNYKSVLCENNNLGLGKKKKRKDIKQTIEESQSSSN